MTTEEMLQEIQEKIAHEYTDFFSDWTSEDWYYPISLSRVLSDLSWWYGYEVCSWQIIEYIEWDFEYNTICYRKLLNENDSDAMLDDQSPETIKAIWEIVCK